jgi:hypothetical protein
VAHDTSPKVLLAELLEQHGALREMMARCELLADDLDAGRIEPGVLVKEVARLRVAFDVHNKFEEHLLRPVLREADSFGDVRIERMVHDHISEHRTMHDGLATTVTGALRATVARLRDHLMIEERYFLSSRVLREDVISVEGGG